jgi:hypothetical protein
LLRVSPIADPRATPMAGPHGGEPVAVEAADPGGDGLGVPSPDQVGGRRVIPTRVKADSFRGFQTGASQTLWRRTGGSPCGQGLHFVRTMTRPSFGP